MKVQITGSGGFVGYHLLRCLKGDLQASKIDLLSPFHVDADVLIHLAGIAHSKNGARSADDYRKVNIEIAKKAFNAFLTSSATKFILLSSVKAVADEFDGIITEDTPASPTTHYGTSKLTADQFILSSSIPSHKSVFILRPAMISGSGVKGNLRSLYTLSRTPFWWILGSIKNKRSYCHISNLCFIIQEIMKRKDLRSGVYLIADDEPLSTSELMLILSGKNRSSRTGIFISSIFFKFLFFFSHVLQLKDMVNFLHKLTGDYMVDNSKVKTELGIQLPFSSIDGIRQVNKNP